MRLRPLHRLSLHTHRQRCGFVVSTELGSMFTGLVEGQGTVRRIASMPSGLRFSIVPDASCFRADETRIGDSIAICGCCLTVVQISSETLDFEAGTETLSKTNLGRLAEGGRVNLERSLAVNARLGGHFVQGHVDGTATVSEIRRSDQWIEMWFAVSDELVRLMVPKGSVTVDGISLTVVQVDASHFSVALIPHTLEVTTLGSRSPGDLVNIENDILGKYVDRLLHFSASRPPAAASPQTSVSAAAAITGLIGGQR